MDIIQYLRVKIFGTGSFPEKLEIVNVDAVGANLQENYHLQRPLLNTFISSSLDQSVTDSYQYQLQSMWQKCWNTNQSLVHNLRFRERGPLKSWRPETMAEAIFSVLKEGLSLSQAARKYDIPYPTFVLYANRVHNMLGPSADGGADLRPKGRGRPQRILLGSWPEEHIRGVIRAVVFRDTQHIKDEPHLPYPRVQDPMQPQNYASASTNGPEPVQCQTSSPGAAAAAAVAAVAQGLRQQMCNMVAASNATSVPGSAAAAAAAAAAAILARENSEQSPVANSLGIGGGVGLGLNNSLSAANSIGGLGSAAAEVSLGVGGTGNLVPGNRGNLGLGTIGVVSNAALGIGSMGITPTTSSGVGVSSSGSLGVNSSISSSIATGGNGTSCVSTSNTLVSGSNNSTTTTSTNSLGINSSVNIPTSLGIGGAIGINNSITAAGLGVGVGNNVGVGVSGMTYKPPVSFTTPRPENLFQEDIEDIVKSPLESSESIMKDSKDPVQVKIEQTAEGQND